MMESYKYFKMAADKGDRIGSYNCRLFVEFGDVGPRNYPLAARFYIKSANKGYIKAMVRYGQMLEHGKGVDVNIHEALRYYKLASDHGNKEAAKFLSNLKDQKNQNNDRNQLRKVPSSLSDFHNRRRPSSSKRKNNKRIKV